MGSPQTGEGKGFWSVQPGTMEEQDQALRTILEAGFPIEWITVAVGSDEEVDRLGRSSMAWIPVHLDEDGPQFERFSS